MAISNGRSQWLNLAEVVRDACLRAALDGYEDAAMRGLCPEGALEAAISAIRMLDLETVLKEQAGQWATPPAVVELPRKP